MAKSLQERLEFIIEEDGTCASCSGGGGSEGGSNDYTGGSSDEGPTAGYDQLLKGLKMLRRKKGKKSEVKENKKELPTTKMTLKASGLDMDADKEQNKNKKFKLLDRARKIRQEIK